jgi:hypothetical protein
MTTPSIPHASNCTDPKAELSATATLWESVVGRMRSLLYYCTDCGETVQIERFEAFEVEEED